MDSFNNSMRKVFIGGKNQYQSFNYHTLSFLLIPSDTRKHHPATDNKFSKII